MRTSLIIGVLLFLGFAIVNAPAGLLRTLLDEAPGVELLQPSGTLWRGRGQLYLSARPAGQIDWRLRPGDLLNGALGYDVRLEGPAQNLRGHVRVGFGEVGIELDGSAAAAFVNRWLSSYDIAIAGDLSFQEASMALPYPLTGAATAVPARAAGTAAGSTSWSGGAVRYRLAGRAFEGVLPPLVAHLGEGLEVVVYPRHGQTPLMQAELLSNGFVRVGITRLLTNMLNNPWPGASADHEVVLELEEQLL